METVNYTAEAFRAAEASGFRATIGKCMMDKGEGVPSALHEEREASVRESLALLEEWHGRADGRLRYCFAPRFAVSCTRELLSEVSRLARERGVMIHTHASENITEIEMVERETGMRNVVYLDSLGLTGQDVALAHCVHLDDAEIDLLARTKTRVMHCPSSNLKLGSGIARVSEMLERGVEVSLGADGAPCNNRLDMLTELRTAALLQKVLAGTESLPARRALRMATIDGARALQLESEIGSLEVGKRADISIINLERLHTSPSTSDTISMIVYAAQSSDVWTVLIDGQVVMREQKLLTLNEREVIEEADRESALLLERAGLA
jgi:5-methylthioadenosine/S-adenosylhomocysteine deaminase